MSPLSAPVLTGAALVSTPALWSMLDGSIALDTGLVRFLVALAVSWVAFSIVAGLIEMSPTQVSPTQPLEATSDRDEPFPR